MNKNPQHNSASLGKPSPSDQISNAEEQESKDCEMAVFNKEDPLCRGHSSALELVRAAKQLLLEERQRRPFLFSKCLRLEKKPSHPVDNILPKATFSPAKSLEAKESLALPHEKPNAVKKAAPETTKNPLSKEPHPLPFHSLRQIIEKSCPALRLKEEIPSDEIAIQHKNAWKHRGFDVEVLLLGFGKDIKQKTLLENIGKAINILGKRCQIIDATDFENERKWDMVLNLPQLGFVIAPPLEMWHSPILKSLLKLHPTTDKTYLGKAEVLFVPPLDKILSDPSFKPKLWLMLCQKLVSPV